MHKSPWSVVVGRVPPSPHESDLHAQIISLSRNNRYYAVVDKHLNITDIKQCYHANLYLKPWLHKALPDIPSFVRIVISQLHIFVVRRDFSVIDADVRLPNLLLPMDTQMWI